MEARKKVSRFSVTHPLGMHARVCSKWVRTLFKMRPRGLEFAQEWAWIEYRGEQIVADSLFQLLEARIPCGAEFDLFLDHTLTYDEGLHVELESIISSSAFEMTS